MRPLMQIAADLREKGLKLTPQRRLIIEILSGDRSHPTVDEVYRQVLAVMPEVSRTTVYNTIREMTALGEIVEVQDLGDGGTRYDTSAGVHHHFFCQACRSLFDLEADLSLPEEYHGEMEGAKIIRQQLTVYGICPGCAGRGTG